LGPRDAELGECRDLAARDRDCAFALTLDRRRRARAEHTVPPLLLQLHQLEDLEDPAEVPAIEAAWKVECARLQGEGKQKKPKATPKARGKGKGKAAQRDDSDDADDDGEADEADEDVRPVKSKGRAAAKKVPAASRKNKKKKAELSSESQSSEEDVKPPPKRRAPRKGIETGETG
jgi:hypothetical protein